MLATSPSARPEQSLQFESSKMTSATNSRVSSPGGSSSTSTTSSPLSDAPALERTLPGWTHLTSNNSTRTGSPTTSSSSTSSDDCRQASGKNEHRDMRGLATRRGVASLDDLVIDFETEGAENSHMNIPSAKGSHCTPCTQKMTSFLPPKTSSASDTSHLSPGTSPSSNQTYPSSLLRTSPTCSSMNKSPGDASQRTTAFQSRFGAAAAGGDASQRSPLGRVSLGVAVLGGDASQRTVQATQLPGVAVLGGDASQRTAQGTQLPGVAALGGDASQRTPPGRTNPTQVGFARGCHLPQPQGRNAISKGACFAVPSPTSSQSATMQDASERQPETSARTPTAVLNGSSLKSWLSGVNAERSFCDQDLAEKLLAAAPDVYED